MITSGPCPHWYPQPRRVTAAQHPLTATLPGALGLPLVRCGTATVTRSAA